MTRTMIHIKFCTYLAAGAALLCQCKPQSDDSRVQSLDDAAQGKTEVNDVNLCGAADISQAKLPAHINDLNNSKAIVSAAGDIAARNAVLTTLAVAPKSLIQLFFLVGNGQIIVGGGTAACSKTPFTATERAIFGASTKVRSCWIAPSNSEPLRLVLDADPKLIRFSLLRLLSYVQAEYFLQRVQSPNIAAPFNSIEWKAYGNGFAANRQRLASAFLVDMKEAGNNMVGDMALHNSSDPISFGNMVYANAVDSYFCSATTNKTFQTSFANTWRVYSDPTDAYSPLLHLGAAGF